MEQETFQTRGEGNLDLEKAMSTLGTDKLNMFRELVGITDVIDLGPRATRRPAPNVGIYKRVASEERKARLQYYSCALLINACLLSQIIFATVLTALGAGHGSHSQITGLGAANTVIAAILTFTKGSGLPNSLRQYQQLLRRVREYIEQRERDFALIDCKLDLHTEIGKINAMYERARQTNENNDPNSYSKPTAAPAQGKPLSDKPMHDQPWDDVRPDGSPAHVPPRPVRSRSDGEPSEKSEGAHTEQPQSTRRDGSERWNIASAVASRLVSSKHPW